MQYVTSCSVQMQTTIPELTATHGECQTFKFEHVKQYVTITIRIAACMPVIYVRQRRQIQYTALNGGSTMAREPQTAVCLFARDEGVSLIF